VQSIWNEGGSPSTKPPSFLEDTNQANGKKHEMQVGQDGKALDREE